MVTVTGANDLTNTVKMAELQTQYPFVEWGILLSSNAEGSARFPTTKWIRSLTEFPGLKLSGHLCGRWVRDLCGGNWTFVSERPYLINAFSRIQLNFHSYPHLVKEKKFHEALNLYPEKQFIFQLDGENNHLLGNATSAGINAVGLFDLSGGAGILPYAWPESRDFFGYAGGLGPENLKTEIIKISEKTSSLAWIDAETKLRSENDNIFDFNKVEEFLKIAEKFVVV